jgi:hypothetical protein
MMVDNYYKINTMLEQKLQEELNRYKAINKYGKTMIMEQDAPPADLPPVPDAPAADAPAVPDAELPADPMAADAPAEAPVDAPAPDAMGGDTEEIDITDLVNMTKSIKKDIETNKNDHGTVISKMDDVFTKLTDLEAKLSEMDQVVAKIDQLGVQVQQMKPETPQEKLEMRSLDSYPFNQNPTQFFDQKQHEMKASGKNEYVLTKDEVTNYSPETIRTSFNANDNEDEFKF